MSKFRLALVGALSVACMVGLVTPSYADPDAVAQAKADLDQIQQSASDIDQQIIEASVRADEAEAKLAGIDSELAKQKDTVAQLADHLGQIAVIQFQSAGFDLTAQLLTSDSESNFLSSLATIQNETDRSNADLQALQVEQARLTSLEEQASRTNSSLQADRQAKIDLAAQFDAKEAEAQAVYDRLNAEEQERLRLLELERQRQQEEADRLAREEAARVAAEQEAARAQQQASQSPSSTPTASNPATPVEPTDISDGSSRAQAAVQHALAQVGKRYVWGTSGPNTFDCSGLTSYAYRQVGISISRSSREQLSVGRPVAKSDLRPGDLVFYYSPVSHVGMYIGDGKIVDAANPRKGVRVTTLNSMPFTTARRVA